MTFLNSLLNFFKGLHPALKSSLFFTLSSGIQQLLNILVTPFFAEIFTTDQFAKYSLYTTWYSLFLILVSFNLPISIINNALIKYQNSSNKFFSTITFLIFGNGVLYIFLIFLFEDFFVNLTTLKIDILYMLIVQVTVNSGFLIWGSIKKFYFDYILFTFIAIISTVSQIGLSMIFVLYISPTPESRIFAVFLVQFFFGFIFSLILILKGKLNISIKYIKYSFKFTIPLFFHYIFQFVILQSDRIIINTFFSSYIVGIYTISNLVSIVLLFFSNGINSSFIPWFFKMMKLQKYSNIKKVSSILFLVFSLFTLFVILIAPELIYFLGSNKYNDAIYLIMPILLGVYFQFSYSLFANFEYYFEYTKSIFWISFFFGFISLCLNFSLLPILSYKITSIIFLITNFLILLLHFYVYRSLLKRNKLKDVLNIKLIIISIIVTVTISSFLFFTFEYYSLLRYLILLFLLFVLFLKRNQIIYYLNNIT
jgi:O-antigen/teichoic acid export membrane protein